MESNADPAPRVVLKFGGTSVAGLAGWRVVATVARAARRDGLTPVVVCSAVAGVSTRIDRLVDHAAAGHDPGPGVQAVAEAHADLAASLGISTPPEVTDALAELAARLDGVRAVREGSPRVRAGVMALGELMSTRLGVAYLRSLGLDAHWVDVRDLLTAEMAPSEGARFLAATVAPVPSPVTLPAADVVVTQGFIARDRTGDTVLLGRGGSDTSASYLGVLLGAARVEVWTDVPGLFTTNPSNQPAARLLARLGYDEAEALAALGARVLHPRCLGPARQARIPLHVRSTFLPEAPGTVIDARPPTPGIKAVTVRRGLVLIRMTRPATWQPVGFLADVAACFARRGLSIDLLSTSASTITATLDPSASPRASLDRLLADLGDVCAVEVERPLASVSLVGTRVRAAFDGLDRLFCAARGVPVRMVAQGASDHHLTLVVEEHRAAEVAARLHATLFETDGVPGWLGPAWSTLAEASA